MRATHHHTMEMGTWAWVPVLDLPLASLCDLRKDIPFPQLMKAPQGCKGFFSAEGAKWGHFPITSELFWSPVEIRAQSVTWRLRLYLHLKIFIPSL